MGEPSARKGRKLTKILFFPTGDYGWYAGVAFFSGLAYSVNVNYGEEVKIYLGFFGENQEKVYRRAADTIVNISSRTLYDRAISKVCGYDYRVKRIINREKINAVFSMIPTQKYGKTPLISWITDFQHKYLPEMFSEEECSWRDKRFLKTAEVSDRVLVKTESIARDFRKFLPQFGKKVRILKFTPIIPENIYDIDPVEVARKYNLPEKFVYFPGNFWKHKNHERFFKAVKMLKDEGKEIKIVCSGYNKDYRNPEYYDELFSKAVEWGIEENIKHVGVIPHEDVLTLMRESICVLNPSLFEGYGMTPREADALGKWVLLSDIPAHREHSFMDAQFFNPTDEEDIKMKLLKVWDSGVPGINAQKERTAREAQKEKIKECADSFMEAVREVI